MDRDALPLDLPAFAEGLVSGRSFPSLDERVALAVALARENVRAGTGGPFGAAVFGPSSDVPVAVGVNRVVDGASCLLHAEVVAIARAERVRGRYGLGAGFSLVCSCAPCAMCLGAVAWSGVDTLAFAASGADARAIGFDEGPVDASSLDYLRARGLRVVEGIRRDDAVAVLRAYADTGGILYAGRAPTAGTERA